MLDRFVNRNTEGLPTLQIGGSQQFNPANPGPSTPTFGISGQKSREAMMSRVEALGRGAISQSAAAAAAASSTGLKRLFANVVEQAKEGAAKKEGKPALPRLSSRFCLSLRSKTVTVFSVLPYILFLYKVELELRERWSSVLLSLLFSFRVWVSASQ